MRPSITWLLILVIGSMLVGTAFAECAAMAMPCCAQHRSSTCHEVCAAPAANVNTATMPQPFGAAQAVAVVSPVVTITRVPAFSVQPSLAPPYGNLLRLIHVLLI